MILHFVLVKNLLLDVSEPNVTYGWQNSSTNATFNVSQTGIYWVDMTFNGCSRRDSISVDYYPAPNLELGSDVSLCIGESLLLDATNPNSTYSWQDNSAGSTFNVTTDWSIPRDTDAERRFIF